MGSLCPREMLLAECTWSSSSLGVCTPPGSGSGGFLVPAIPSEAAAVNADRWPACER